MATTKKTAAKKTTAKKAASGTTRKTASKKAPTGTFRTAAHTVLDTFEANVADGFAAARALVDAKDFKSALETQQKYLQSAAKRTGDSARKLNELATEAVAEARQPIVERYKAATEKFESTFRRAA